MTWSVDWPHSREVVARDFRNENDDGTITLLRREMRSCRDLGRDAHDKPYEVQEPRPRMMIHRKMGMQLCDQ